MNNQATSPELLSLLNQAIGRELHVSVQYILQQTIGAGQALVSVHTPPTEPSKFVASHAQMWLPGVSLKKIAVTEMRHAEAIVERLVLLGGQLTARPEGITIGDHTQQMLEMDREEERTAIALYKQILEVAGKQGDDITGKLFRGILADEEKHHRMFSKLLGKE